MVLSFRWLCVPDCGGPHEWTGNVRLISWQTRLIETIRRSEANGVKDACELARALPLKSGQGDQRCSERDGERPL
jgi:hypothetical protein